MNDNRPVIRLETPGDYRAVENLTREAFWNQSVPGCDEHYLVHTMRRHPDFIPELAFVLEKDGEIVGNIMYTKGRLVDGQGHEKPCLTFGPISVAPAQQRKGYGRMLIEHSFEVAMEMGYEVVVIFGNPDNYVARGFKSGRKYNVYLEGDRFPAALLVKELRSTADDGTSTKAPLAKPARMKRPRRPLTRPSRRRRSAGSPVRRNSTSTVIRA